MNRATRHAGNAKIHIVQWDDILWALPGGLMLGLAYPPTGAYPLAWIALIPLFRTCAIRTPRTTFLIAWVFYVSMMAVAFQWPIFHFRSDTAIISTIALVTLSMFLALPFALASSQADRIGPRSTMILAAVLVVGLEILLELGPIPMPWTALGNSQASSDFMVHASSYIGANGLGMCIVTTNMALAQAFLFRNTPDKRGRRMVLPILIATGIAISFYVVFEDAPRTTPSDADTTHAPDGEYLKIGILQPGYSAQQWAQTQDRSRLDSLLKWSTPEPGVFQPDMIIWPETALPYSIRPDSLERFAGGLGSENPVFGRVSRWAQANHIAILTGGIMRSRQVVDASVEMRRKFLQNSVLYFDPSGGIEHHGKNILVPFAEYVPLSMTFPGLASLAVPAGGVAGYLPETTPSEFTSSPTPFGVMICFESVFPSYARKLAQTGSEFLVVLTQDGWWRSSSPPIQHFYFNRFRAAETGLAVIQVSVDGVSGVFMPDGSVAIRTKIGTREQRIVDVPLRHTATFYMKFGESMRILWLAAAILLLIILRRPLLNPEAPASPGSLKSK